MDMTIRGEQIDPYVMERLHKFQGEEDIDKRVNSLLNGKTWQLIRYPQELSPYKDDLSSYREIIGFIHSVPANHPVLSELLSQANRTLLTTFEMTPDNSLLHYPQGDNNRISNSMYAAIASRDETLFQTYLKMTHHFIDNPILKNTTPPEEEYIMYEISGIANFHKEHEEELRDLVSKIDNLQLGSYLPFNILTTLGDISTFDRFIKLYDNYGAPKYSEFIWNGWKKKLAWKHFGRYTKLQIIEQSPHSEEYIDRYIINLLTGIEDKDKVKDLNEIFIK